MGNGGWLLFSGWLADHCEWYLQLVVVPSVKTTIDAHPRYHNSLPVTISGAFTEYHEGGYHVVGRLHPSLTLHIRHTQELYPNDWQAVSLGNAYVQVPFGIFSSSRTGIFSFETEEKSLGGGYSENRPRGKKNLPEEIRLHAWTFRSHSRTIKSNQERGESWDFRSQRLNFLVIHRQKLNLEEFDSEVSIARKKNNRKYLTMCICLYTNRKRYKQTLMSAVDFNYLCTVIENGFLLIYSITLTVFC